MKKLLFILCILRVVNVAFAQPYLPLTAGSGNPLSGILYSESPPLFVQNNIGTNSGFGRFSNSGGNLYIGRDNSAGGNLISGSPAYSGVLNVESAHPLVFGTNSLIRYAIDASGNHDFKSGTVAFGGTATFNVSAGTAILSAVPSDIYSFLSRNTASSDKEWGLLPRGNDFAIRETGIADVMIFKTGGNVGIGTTSPTEKLSVNGKILAKEVRVETGWSDFVFEPTYKLRGLKETEQFIKENKHLPEIPSAKEVAENGINLGEMNAKLLQKIEELTLYLIELSKENKEQGIKIKNLQEGINQLKSKP